MFRKRAKFLVSPPEFDDIGSVLKSFGSGWRFDTCDWDDLANPKNWMDREAVYLNCSVQLANEEYVCRLAPTIQKYVEAGGTVYASDWALSAVQHAFPSFLRGIDNDGSAGTYDCSITDSGLREMLGGNIRIKFDLGAWVLLNNVDERVRLYVEADNLFQGSSNGRRLPVVVGFQYGSGHVLATSFHNEKQLSDREKQLLRFLALQPALARTASSSSNAMAARDCTAGLEVMETINPGQSQRFHFDSNGKPMLFVLNWQGDAELQLTIRDPTDATVQERAAASGPLICEVAPSRAGRWCCVITGLNVPHKNFPFVLSIASFNRQQVLPPPRRRGAPAPKDVPKSTSLNPSSIHHGPPPPRR